MCKLEQILCTDMGHRITNTSSTQNPFSKGIFIKPNKISNSVQKEQFTGAQRYICLKMFISIYRKTLETESFFVEL